MKKLLLLTLLVLTMVSCTFEDNEPDTYLKVIPISIDARDWVYKVNDPNPYYSYTVNMPEITSYVYKGGTVQTYFVDEENDVQISLPFTRYKQDNSYLWSTTIDAEYCVGAMSFFVTHSDFAINNPPGDMTVRVVIMW